MREIDIAAYIDGRLSEEDRKTFERRLERDVEGRDIVNGVTGILDDAEEVTDVPERLVQKVRELYPRRPDIFDLVVSLAGRALRVVSALPEAGIAVPAAAGAVRGPIAGLFPYVVLTRVFQHARVDVYIERMAGDTCAFTIKAADAKDGGPLKAVRAELASGYRELASSPLEDGTALFEDVRIGSYAITLRRQDDVIGRMSVKITGE